MRYTVRTLIGFSLIAAAWVALGYAIYQLLQVGTCASGGPFVSARECPSGLAGLMLAIPGALLIMGVGVAIYATRGKAPGSDSPPHNGLIAVWLWTGIFWSIAAGCFLGVWGPDADPGPGGKSGGLIVGFLFVPMGALGLGGLALRGNKPKSIGSRTVIPGAIRATRAMSSRLPGGDPVDRLERLGKLRAAGSISEAEFAELKRKILAGEA